MLKRIKRKLTIETIEKKIALVSISVDIASHCVESSAILQMYTYWILPEKYRIVLNVLIVTCSNDERFCPVFDT